MTEERFQCKARNMEGLEEKYRGQPPSCPTVSLGYTKAQFGNDATKGHLEIESPSYDKLLGEISTMKMCSRRHGSILLGVSLLLVCGCVLLAVLVGVTKHQLSQLQARVETLTTRYGEIEKRVPDKEMTLVTLGTGHIVWRIKGWAARTQSARQGCCEVIFSDKFYSHENGYTMCLSVHPNGDKAGKGTHLSLFFYLMRGPFDNFLSWPFTHKVVFSLINQRTGIDHTARFIEYKDFPNHTNWNQPKMYRNDGFGYFKMISTDELSKTDGLIHDDSISIRCIVK